MFWKHAQWTVACDGKMLGFFSEFQEWSMFYILAVQNVINVLSL